MRNQLFIFVFLTSIGILNAQDLSPELLGFQSYELKDSHLGDVNYYVSKIDRDHPKPLLVYLDGSGHYPLYQKMNGGYGSTVVFDLEKLTKEYTVLLISKPGVPFIDNMEMDSTGYPIYKEPKEYTERLSMDWRVASASKIINLLIKEQMVNAQKVVVLGFSEGAQVGPFVAENNKHVTHLMLFGGNGLNQFIDPIIATRMKATTGQITEEEAQNQIDSLFIQYKKIYENPESTDRFWWGHTYQRWASFTQDDPYHCLANLDIPIYFANGSLDENSVISADYIQLEFIKRQKSNLTYKTYPNYDHQFNEIKFEGGVFVDAISRIDAVMQDAFNWLSKWN